MEKLKNSNKVETFINDGEDLRRRKQLASAAMNKCNKILMSRPKGKAKTYICTIK